MKKVWVLEKFQTPEDMKVVFENLKKVYLTLDGEDKDKAFEALEKFADKVNDNPDGMWIGWNGKCKYSDFCRESIETITNEIIEYNKKKQKINIKSVYRVVSAEIENNSKTWMGYVNPVENEGVMKYLVARSLDNVKGR